MLGTLSLQDPFLHWFVQDIIFINNVKSNVVWHGSRSFQHYVVYIWWQWQAAVHLTSNLSSLILFYFHLSWSLDEWCHSPGFAKSSNNPHLPQQHRGDAISHAMCFYLLAFFTPTCNGSDCRIAGDFQPPENWGWGGRIGTPLPRSPSEESILWPQSLKLQFLPPD